MSLRYCSFYSSLDNSLLYPEEHFLFFAVRPNEDIIKIITIYLIGAVYTLLNLILITSGLHCFLSHYTGQETESQRNI